jgi:gliding motility-associated-like protein
LSISGSSGTYTYTWSDAAGGSGTGTTYTVTNIGPAGSFTVSVIANDANNCLSTPATVTITVNPPPTGPVIGGGSSNPLVECQGSTAQPVVVATTGTVTSVPVWYNGSTLVNVGTSYTPGTTTPGTTVYTVIDSATATGCKDASAGNVLTVTVTINPTPTGPALGGGSSNPLVECQNSTPQSVIVTPTGTVTSVPVWYNGSMWVNTGTSYTPGTSTPGTTVYTVIDSATATGCKNASANNVLTVTVTVLAPPTPPVLTGGITNPVVECQNAGQSVTVATTGTITSIPVWYNGATWVNAGTSYTPPSSVPGTTVYTVVDSATVYGCKDASAGNVLTVTVTVNPSPTVTGNASVTGSCTQPTGSVTGINVSGGTPGYHYQWYNGSTPIAGDTLPSLTNAGPGTYSVQITDANGCPVSGGTTAFTVPSSAVVAGFIANPNLGPAPLTVSFTNNSTGATNYGWTFDGVATSTQANPSYIYNNAGTYTVVMIATNGTCTDTARTTIIVDVPTTIVIPNVFSPNGDNINEEFGIVCTGMKSLTCDIFNRWGQKVFTITAPNQTWDGRMDNGHMASEGTYFFMVNALGVDGKTYTYQGPLTLVK